MKLTIVRGHPGSGKTTFAENLVQENSNLKHFENDQFFTKNGVYEFDITRHQEAKDWCLKSVSDALQEGFDVVVSSTFTTLAEMRPFLDCVYDECEVVELWGDFGSTHNVPEQVIQAKKDQFESFPHATQIHPTPKVAPRPGR